MKLAKCKYNHFYDAEKYNMCPHCKEQNVNVSPSLQNESETVQLEQNPKSIQKESGERALFFQKYFSGKSKMSISKEKKEDDETISLYEQSKVEKNQESVLKEFVEPKVETSKEIQNEETQVLQKQEMAQDSMVLKNVINQAKASSPFEESKTIGFYQAKENEPVVGWLVFIKGEYVGESFTLKEGRNNVGRSLKMDIALAKDLSVSRERHMILTYEPKKRKFYIQPGESNGLTYVNDELLLVPCELKGQEELQIGNSKCIFVPFCGEKFGWEDYI